jgi:hypothetical protein
MLTRFVSDSAWGAPEYVYPYDDSVSFKNYKLYVAGNMNINYSPFLDNLKDFQNNNYSCLYLTNKKTLSSIVDIEIPRPADDLDATGLLGVFMENGLVKENTRFLECLPLYRHGNDFSISFADFYNSYTGLSGSSLIFSSADPVLSAFEIGFAIDGAAAIYNNKKVFAKYPVVAGVNMHTTARNLSTLINNFNFCRYLSGSVEEYGKAQTIKITISAKQGLWDTSNLKGVSITLGNTKLGALSASKLEYNSRFALRFNIDGVFFNPPGYNINEYYSMAAGSAPAPKQLTSSSQIHSVVNALTTVFDPVKTGSDYYPVSRFFGIKNIEYDNRGFAITIFNRLSGSVIEEAKIYNGFGSQSNILKLEVLNKGIDSGFHLQFKRKTEPTTLDFILPDFYSSYNTFDSLTSLSIFHLNQFLNEKEYFYKPRFITILGENNNIFLDFNFLNESQVVITHSLYKRKAYLVSDDLNRKLNFIDSRFISDSNLAVATFNYVYDESTNRIIVYKTINDNIYAIGDNGGEVIYNLVYSFADIPESSIFDIIRYNDVSIDFGKSIWASYEKTYNTNNLNLNENKSFDVKNNFLVHSEYSNSEENIHVNVLPLKNQLNEVHRQGRRQDGVDFREYHSIYTGDNTELGSSHITLGYLTDNKEYVFKPGQVTWFHLPYNESYKRININDANFILNGAIPGKTPVFSDKIFKKIGDYREKSNLGSSKKEQTGQWLCAWLSGGDDGSTAMWVDRFYNPDIITEIEAIKFVNNVEYIPSYVGKNYQQGFSDRPSALTFEPGVWYAYNHIGKADANHLISFLKPDLVQEGLIGENIPTSGEYDFNSGNTGFISLQNYKTPSNQFTLSFYGHSDDWNKPMGNQLLGNYMDSGLGIYNFKEVTPFTYYFNKRKLSVYNNENVEILTATVPESLSGNIVGLFRRDFNENFHIVLDNLYVLEYSLEGTLVDLIPNTAVFPDPIQKRIVSVANNYNFGVILFSDLSYTTVNLKTNIAKLYGALEAATLVDKGGGEIPAYSVYIDQSNFVYVINGRQPVLREDKLYYIDNYEPRHLIVYNTIKQDYNTFIDASRLEQEPASSRTKVAYTAEGVYQRVFPYTSFNLTQLSGIGINLYPGYSEGYNLGVSIYKDPFIYYFPGTNTPGYIPEKPISVDLHGNYWYVKDELKREELNLVYNADKLGYSVKINDNNLILVGDPFYNERLGATDRRYGAVFLNTIGEDYNLKPTGIISLGPKPAVSRLTYYAFSEVSSLEATISSFPLSGNIIFYNGSDVYSHPYGNSTNARQVSALSLAFTVDGSAPYHPDPSVTNKFAANFTTPLTSIDILTTQLQKIFNSNIVPHPSYVGNLALSSFFDFSFIDITELGFTIEITNKFEGQTPLISLPNTDPPVSDALAGVVLPPGLPNVNVDSGGLLLTLQDDLYNNRKWYKAKLPNNFSYELSFYDVGSEQRWQLEYFDVFGILTGLWETVDFPSLYSDYPWNSGLFTRVIDGITPETTFVYKQGNNFIRPGVRFSNNNYLSPDASTYQATTIKPGKDGIGQNGERFGWQIVGSPFRQNITTDFTKNQLRMLVISSPQYSKGGLSVGKITCWKNFNYAVDDDDNNALEKFEIVSPRLVPEANFGKSLAFYPWFYYDQNTEARYLVVGSPVGDATYAPQSSAYLYLLDANINSSYVTFTGQTSAGYAYDVDINKTFVGVSSPLEYQTQNGSIGGVTLIKMPALFSDNVRNFAFSDTYKTLIFSKNSRINIKPPALRYGFGTSFKLFEDSTLAVGSVGRTKHGLGQPIVDIYEYDSLNFNFYHVSAIEIPFTLAANPTAISMDIDVTKDRLVVGAWTGDVEDFGNEYGVVRIWHKKGKNFHFVYDRVTDLSDPTKFKQYNGKSVSVVDDRLLTGTTFIYNTGNSLLFAVSAINTAIERQTFDPSTGKSAFKTEINYVSENVFVTSIISNISAEDTALPDININASLPNNIIKFYLDDYFKGASLIYSGRIVNYNFTIGEETEILTDFNTIKTYDILGEYKSEVDLRGLGLSQVLSCIRFGINNLLNNQTIEENYSLLAVDPEGVFYKANYIPAYKTFEIDIIDTKSKNEFFFPSDPTFENVLRYSFDTTNSSFGSGLLRLISSIPSLSFKLRLNNRLDLEQSEIFEPKYTTENLSRGWHHFTITLDTVKGFYTGYIDARRIFNYNFKPGKYTFSPILKNNISVGATPYFNNTLFDNFYKSRKPKFAARGFKIDEIRFHNRSVTDQEVKLLSYTKFEPNDMRLQLSYGFRNYLDTITRVARHKAPGRKSQFIDIHINDSLIADISLQKYYETKILAELKNYLPAYVKINKIVWGSNKPTDNIKAAEGDINVGNTLTDSGGIND